VCVFCLTETFTLLPTAVQQIADRAAQFQAMKVWDINSNGKNPIYVFPKQN